MNTLTIHSEQCDYTEDCEYKCERGEHSEDWSAVSKARIRSAEWDTVFTVEDLQQCGAWHLLDLFVD